MATASATLLNSRSAPLPRLHSIHAANGLLQIASGHRQLVLDTQTEERGTDGHCRASHAVAVLALTDARALILALEAAVAQAANPASLRPVPLTPVPAPGWRA